jgi:hypothetical protein
MDEVPTRMEPCLFDGGLPAALARTVGDAVVVLSSEQPRLPRPAHAAAVQIVAAAEAWHSCMIERQSFDPVDLERDGSSGDGSSAAGKACLGAILAFDREAADGTFRPFAATTVSAIHADLYERLPPDLRIIPGGSSGIAIVPGALRSETAQNVVVGRHHPPASARVDAFMAHFERRYSNAAADPAARLVAAAAAHHRLAFIHPFPDGNGRTGRIATRCALSANGLDFGGLWSLSRALAGPDGRDYLRMIDHADMPRQGALDGRGNLSLRALADFCGWFASRAASECAFAKTLFDPATIGERFAQCVVEDCGTGAVDEAMTRFNGAVETTSKTGRLREAGYLGVLGEVVFPLRQRNELVPGLFP